MSTANLPPLSDELAVRQLLGLSLADVHTVEGKEPFTPLLLLLFCQPCDVAGDDPCHADARRIKVCPGPSTAAGSSLISRTRVTYVGSR